MRRIYVYLVLLIIFIAMTAFFMDKAWDGSRPNDKTHTFEFNGTADRVVVTDEGNYGTVEYTDGNGNHYTITGVDRVTVRDGNLTLNEPRYTNDVWLGVGFTLSVLMLFPFVILTILMFVDTGMCDYFKVYMPVNHITYMLWFEHLYKEALNDKKGWCDLANMKTKKDFRKHVESSVRDDCCPFDEYDESRSVYPSYYWDRCSGFYHKHQGDDDFKREMIDIMRRVK